VHLALQCLLSQPQTSLYGSWLGFFLKIGSILFGGGYVLVAFLQGGLVDEYGWLTQQQLLDAIAIGQFTPGPILSTATFIGYIIAGIPGAIVSQSAFSYLLFFYSPFKSPCPSPPCLKWTAAFLDAVNVSSVALMLVVTLQLGIATLTTAKPPYLDFFAVVIAIISAILAIRYQINAVWIVLGAALMGGGASFLGYTG
jgi:chromate transporter